MATERGIASIENWCCNAKMLRSSTLSDPSPLLKLRAKLYKKAQKVSSKVRSHLEALLIETDFFSKLMDAQRDLVIGLFSYNYANLANMKVNCESQNVKKAKKDNEPRQPALLYDLEGLNK